MINFFNSLLGNSSNIDNSIYRLHTVEGLDSPGLENAISNLKEDKVDAYLIKNVLNEEQISLLKRFYFSLEERDKADDEIAGTYPVSFVTKMYAREKEKSYFEDNEKFGIQIKEETGLDLVRFIEDTISRLNGGKETRIKRPPGKKGTFAPIQFRSLRENGGNIHVHCENCHQTWAPELNDALGDQKLQLNVIPYFFTLQDAKGGKITLFDILWKDGQTIEQIDKEHFKIVNPNGKKIDCSPNGRIKRMEIDTEPGDLFLFNGGKIWHMVSSVHDSRKRITAGGFINTSQENKDEIWA